MHLGVRPVSYLPRGILQPQVGSLQCWKQNEMRPGFPILITFLFGAISKMSC